VCITDEVQGSGRHRVRSFFHLAPGTKPAQLDDHRLDLDVLTLSVEGAPVPEVVVVDRPVAIDFGCVEDASAVAASVEAALPVVLRTELAIRPLSTIAEGEPVEGGS
jgi:hypothetical protein